MEPIKERLRLIKNSLGSTCELCPEEGDNSIYDCHECKDKEILLVRVDGNWEATPCQCKKRKNAKRIIKNSGLTDAQRNMTFDSFKPDKATSEVYMTAMQYVNQFPEIVGSKTYRKGIGITGTVGIGKTHLLCAVANALLEKHIPVVFVSTTNLIAELYDAVRSEGNDHNLNRKIDFISTADVVIFDDVGKEKITEWVQTQYYRIINNRYVNQMPTLFTSNCDLDEISDKVGDAVASRLYELTKGKYFYISANDYRLSNEA